METVKDELQEARDNNEELLGQVKLARMLGLGTLEQLVQSTVFTKEEMAKIQEAK